MAKKLWGGRFSKPIDPGFEDFSRSIHYDAALAEYDIMHSILHVKALFHAELLDKTESGELHQALNDLLNRVYKGEFAPDPGEEDIHSAVQNELERSVGKLALKLHTLRSRNDQIAFDVKLYAFSRGLNILQKLIDVIASFRLLSEKYPSAPFIGYTHTQRAQIIRFADYCKAYASMFGRDSERVRHFLDHLNIRIGAGALAGSSIPYTAYEKAVLEYDPENEYGIEALENALDHVADRDFVIELLSVLSIVQMHLSRFSEDMILYSTAEFDYVDLPEEFCTGSSLMPHKKNADMMELIRGHSGTVAGDLVSLLVTMKGLPLSYNRDMQLDKEPLFRSVDLVEKEMDLIARFVPGIELKEEKIRLALQDEHLYGVEIAEFLVHHGAAFRDAHDIVGKLIRYSEENDCKLRDIPHDKLTEFHPFLAQEALKEIMTPDYAVRQKKSVKREK